MKEQMVHISGKLAIVGIVVFIVGLIMTFILAYVVGNPIMMFIRETTPPSAIPGIMAVHGLDQPIYIQFFYYIKDLISGNVSAPPLEVANQWWAITTVYLGGLILFIISLVYYLLKGRKTG
jgi:peptide/nickel transport system permease protein